MDQKRIGAFICERRKAVGLTQMQLAERLGITDRAVSKWETGRSLPDSAIMLELCEILNIGVNDLLCGEEVSDVTGYNEKMEKNLLEMVKQKQRADKMLLFLEIIVCVICVSVFLALCAIAAFVQMADWLRYLLIIIGVMPLVIALPFMIKIEQTAGYYQCARCGHKYVPTYISVFGAMHFGRTRYMKCPECNKYSWNKKVISREEKNS